MDKVFEEPTIVGMDELEDIAICYQQILSLSQRESISHAVQECFPGRRVIVLDGGAKVENIGISNRLHQIEEKLDCLISCLAEFDKDQTPLTDMDGNEYGLDRDDEGMLS